ncbi:hypothetical protein NQ314_010500 [Rhamnusium bicolor]|uniref:Uncharacterized protein n=1 Tax=Rhamnusium bicolor TaxID=1586634 RepID=A0AAV8XQJ9_9CUCU|nr:hypothetical protein NQ314_010500 [Rhamnusium bicolor]
MEVTRLEMSVVSSYCPHPVSTEPTIMVSPRPRQSECSATDGITLNTRRSLGGRKTAGFLPSFSIR